MLIHSFSFDDIPQFSTKDKAYALEKEYLKPFINDFPSVATLIKHAKEKQDQFSSDQRALLVDVLRDQYLDRKAYSSVLENIELLAKDSTFTLITAHQPSLMTGPLYYIYKILSAINIAELLNKEQAKYTFVPLFISGGEDHDFDEIKYCKIFGKIIEWNREQEGAVGRMSTEGLAEVLDELSAILGERSKVKDLLSEIKDCLAEASNYASFQNKVVNRLFGKYGLVCLNMDDSRLKSSFSSVIKEELVNGVSQALVEETQSRLTDLQHSPQAHARDINLFLHYEGKRYRITKEKDDYLLVNVDKRFSQQAILDHLAKSPASFSPNVIMRPLFQEFCLPNVAYIGGGGEIAYWLERKTQFEHFKLVYPLLIRRNSALILEEKDASTWDKMNLGIQSLFSDFDVVVNELITQSADAPLNLDAHKSESEAIFERMAALAKTIDPSVAQSILAASSKQHKIIDQFESRLKRAVKAKEENKVKKIKKIKDRLFPNNGLQERTDNIFQYISLYGESFIDELKNVLPPLSRQFVVIQLESSDYPS